RPWMNTALTPVERATLLVQQMTLVEKILEIHMIDQPAHPREVPGIPRLGIPTFKITNGPAGAGPGDSPDKQPATALPSALALPAFEAAVKQGDVAAVMCAYPMVNGKFGCENTHLLKDILRDDWGFQGFVQSDYTATHSTVPAALAGLDLSMRNDFYGAPMKAAVQSGQLAESVVD